MYKTRQTKCRRSRSVRSARRCGGGSQIQHGTARCNRAVAHNYRLPYWRVRHPGSNLEELSRTVFARDAETAAVKKRNDAKPLPGNEAKIGRKVYWAMPKCAAGVSRTDGTNPVVFIVLLRARTKSPKTKKGGFDLTCVQGNAG